MSQTITQTFDGTTATTTIVNACECSCTSPWPAALLITAGLILLAVALWRLR